MKKYLVCHCCSNASEFTLVVRVNSGSEGEELAKKINESVTTNPGKVANEQIERLLMPYLDDAFVIDSLAHSGSHLHRACLASFVDIGYINWTIF